MPPASSRDRGLGEADRMRASHSLLSARQAVSPNPSRRKRGGLAYVDGGHAVLQRLH